LLTLDGQATAENLPTHGRRNGILLRDELKGSVFESLGFGREVLALDGDVISLYRIEFLLSDVRLPGHRVVGVAFDGTQFDSVLAFL